MVWDGRFWVTVLEVYTIKGYKGISTSLMWSWYLQIGGISCGGIHLNIISYRCIEEYSTMMWIWWGYGWKRYRMYWNIHATFTNNMAGFIWVCLQMVNTLKWLFYLNKNPWCFWVSYFHKIPKSTSKHSDIGENMKKRRSVATNLADRSHLHGLCTFAFAPAVFGSASGNEQLGD